jgi:hypothetical protein
MFRKRRGRPPKQQKEHQEEHEDYTHDILNKPSKRANYTYGLNDKTLKKPINDYTSPHYKEDKTTASDKKLKHYVDTNRLEFLINEYYQNDIIVDELALALYNIAHRVAYMPNFLNYSWREEMIGDGLIKVFTALQNKKYNPKYGRAFAYFTQIVFHSFCNRIKKEKKAHEVLNDYQQEEYTKLMFEFGVNKGGRVTTESDSNANED